MQEMFIEQLHYRPAAYHALKPEVVSAYAALPSVKGEPLPSVEISQSAGRVITAIPEWRSWKIRGLSPCSELLFLKEIHFLAGYASDTVRLGYDLLFWIEFAGQVRDWINRHQYLPVMKAYQGRDKRSGRRYAAGWRPASLGLDQSIKEFAAAMPASCRSLRLTKPSAKQASAALAWQAPDLLHHFAEQQIDRLVRETPITQQLGKALGKVWISNALDSQQPQHKVTLDESHWRQWSQWRNAVLGPEADRGFVVGLRLEEGAGSDGWAITFFVESREDPSLQLTLEMLWTLESSERDRYGRFLGAQFEKELLINLGQAARICPLLWEGLEGTEPTGVQLSLEGAYAFLKNDAAVLEAAGIKVSVPAWWTSKGRQRARIRIQASGSAPSETSSGGYFNLASVVTYQYELAVGDRTISEDEWHILVNAKSPLIKFRGQWMEVDSSQIGQLLTLMREREEGEPVAVSELLRASGEAEESTFVLDEVLTSMLHRLADRRQMHTLETPPGMQGELREYQKQGLSWLAYQEAVGLHPCLADDMGLGKTIQVIALLLHERQAMRAADEIGPTLLIAPTSVLGNWQKEMQRFAPELASLIHHGSTRHSRLSDFRQSIAQCDVVITSFALIRRDKKIFSPITWHRIVVDEAQNIKNPRSAQTRVVQQLKADHRLALTGTPIENRLMDLWSIFHFLNPGYLGSAAQFRRAYETPIQRDSNRLRSQQLRRVVHPFILRRLKTDKAIINDLPDKVEQKVYCNLTVEQASLYQAVVDDVQEQLESAEGIGRKGLILSTLMKLKQVCNHPAQFLQDGSEFTAARSHKLARVDEMIDEVLQEGDSLLLFTQFTEIGDAMEKQLRERFHCPVYYLHGGTTRLRREAMIERFQDRDSPPGVFVLSLKAGGVGITLTRANHVFHFDRWWNPAVENQATDRAFRIGQEKTVFAHKMVTLGTLEERIDQMLHEKQKLADSIVGSDESWLTEMDNEAFCELIELNRETILEA